MPRKSPVPKYRRHVSGQAFVQHKSIPNKSNRYYLGAYGTEQSLKRYRQFLTRLQVDPAASATKLARKVGSWPTIDELIIHYQDHAADYYSRDYGLSPEYDGMIAALRPLSAMYGDELAGDFGPRCLVAIRTRLVNQKYARNTINHTVSRIKRFFRWACENEYAPPELHHKLLCVKGLAHGQSNATEGRNVAAAPLPDVLALLPFLSPVVSALAQTQMLCGMRPTEACIMRTCDVEQSGAVWLYRPQRHKTQWRRHSLIKAIPPVAQRVMQPYLRPDFPAGYLFEPRAAKAWAAEQRRMARPPRRTPRYPSEERRVAREKANAAIRESGRGFYYTRHTYGQALDYGFDKAAKAGVKIGRFTPNQLRHTIATFVSQKLGQQAASRWLGHQRLATTDIYTEIQVSELTQIAEQLDGLLASIVPPADS